MHLDLRDCVRFNQFEFGVPNQLSVSIGSELIKFHFPPYSNGLYYVNVIYFIETYKIFVLQEIKVIEFTGFCPSFYDR